MPENNNLEGTSDRSEFDEAMRENGRLELRSESAKRALKTANERLRRSTHQKNPVIRYGYNEYMEHHYAYMENVAEIRELESSTRCRLGNSHGGRNAGTSC